MNNNTITCAFCGYAYPDNTPTFNHIRLAEHIRTCPNHPIGIENRALKEIIKKLDLVQLQEALEYLTQKCTILTSGNVVHHAKNMETVLDAWSRKLKEYNKNISL